MRTLKKSVDDGLLVKVNNSYKLSNGARKNLKEAAAKKYMTKPKPQAYSGIRAHGDSDTEAEKEGSSFLERMRRLVNATKKKAAPKKKAVSMSVTCHMHVQVQFHDLIWNTNSVFILSVVT